MRGYGNRNIGNSIYYIGLMVRDEKENSDWFSERSEFCNTDWTGHEAVYIGCKTLLIFCSHFLGHQKRKNEINVLLFSHVGIPVEFYFPKQLTEAKRQDLRNRKPCARELVRSVLGKCWSRSFLKVCGPRLINLKKKGTRPIFSQYEPHANGCILNIYITISISQILQMAKKVKGKKKITWMT